ncbi:MAG: HPr kinase/phosphatase C-terminal domain-containing protein [Pseudomonadota bacterium]
MTSRAIAITLAGMAHLIHATAVCIDGKGILLTGEPGAGKSDLALRLIDQGATLVGDDALVLEDGYLRAPARLKGKIEARGIGILSLPHVAKAVPLALEIALVPRVDVVRLPSLEEGGYGCPVLRLYAFDASTTMKVKHAALQLSALRKAAAS